MNKDLQIAFERTGNYKTNMTKQSINLISTKEPLLEMARIDDPQIDCNLLGTKEIWVYGNDRSSMTPHFHYFDKKQKPFHVEVKIDLSAKRLEEPIICKSEPRAKVPKSKLKTWEGLIAEKKALVTWLSQPNADLAPKTNYEVLKAAWKQNNRDANISNNDETIVESQVEPLLEMARVGYMNPQLEVYVGTNDGGEIPHFHIRGRNEKTFKEVCVKYETAEYFNHGPHKGKLNSKQVKELYRFMLSPSEDEPEKTNWKVAVIEWNRNNSRHKLNPNIDCPNYRTINKNLRNRSRINESLISIDGFEVVDGDGLKHICDSLQKFGLYQIFRIYDSDDITYCLMRRCDNGKYFYTTIVDAPELGKNETKFKPLSHKDVPRAILLASLSLIRQLKMERI